MATGGQMGRGSPVQSDSDSHPARAAGCVWAAGLSGAFEWSPTGPQGAKPTGVFCHLPARGAAAPRTVLRAL